MMRLHGYWRSTASYRVRIALNLKGVADEHVSHDLRLAAQRDPDYLALQPQGLVPMLESSEGTMIQSPAILEWVEETFPDPPLLPEGRGDRAMVRAMAAIIGCDVHPLNNLRVLNSLRHDCGMDQAAVNAWIARWIVAGFGALEPLIQQHGGAFAFGDSPTMADVYIVPQVYSAERFGVGLSPFPRLIAAAAAARALPAFAAADPAAQPDADPS
ncbi:maleylacetoacetate isomerase [Sphingobium chlorophenolicum L-1]|uniref:Maleylacetoacetate isomerase n=1 Tax=Sphingobium chlorophenolicum L-1 TaxID=690566 RepID=F6EWX7_SPHCR|nr:maleylacetoacetate isomerase [Sphingobium chlorophenolicum]AEG48140.1 maleylacetoacetate isomerase [Sphingobium chlorophenolicum L-1]